MDIKVGIRKSQLASVQLYEIEVLLKEKNLDFLLETKEYSTSGDRDTITSLFENQKDDIFTDDLDKALLGGDIDIAVHSAKDLPQNLPSGLQIYALTKSLDTTDCLLAKNLLDELPKGAKVGTSSIFTKKGCS